MKTKKNPFASLEHLKKQKIGKVQVSLKTCSLPIKSITWTEYIQQAVRQQVKF